MKIDGNVPGSFRDPSGFLFNKDGKVYRQISLSYKENYDLLMSSGLYESLVTTDLLIPHAEVDITQELSGKAYKIIQPELIPFVSYPYEWSFSQLKHAALTTLEIQKKSLHFGMSMKDSSAYNIQFRKGAPVLIDSLSFEKYREGKPWVAYRQFCQHFLAPLALMSLRDIRLNQLLRVYIDGVPLDLTSTLLPISTRFKLSLLSHIHLHAKSQKHFAHHTEKKDNRKVTKLALLGIIDSLESTIKRLEWNPKGTEWADYYDDVNYSKEALEHKRQVVAEFLNQVNPKNVWDLGANLGMFSRIAAAKGIDVISFDIDPAAVEKNYLECIEKKEKILPLLIDFTNPSPGIGWENREIKSLLERGPVEMALVLALIHHLAISNNLPLERIASFLYGICSWLVIEFVPKSDSQVQRLLATREDIFSSYTQKMFEVEFKKFFVIEDAIKIEDVERMVYLMRKKQSIVNTVQ